MAFSIGRSLLTLTLALGLSACAAPIGASDVAGPNYGVERVFHIGGEGRWDYVTLDPSGKLLFLPRQTHTQVIRTESGEVVADLKDTPGVHGVALVPELNRGFTSNGKGNSITIFDLKTFNILGTAKAGENPDAILYDPASKKVLAFNGRSGDVTVIDPSAAPDQPAAKIAVGGKLEFAQADGAGHVYVNVEDKSSVAVIDTKAMKVTDVWKLEGGEEPTGMAIDVAHHHLFVGCGNSVLAVVDTQSGKTVTTVPIGKGCDACAFDAGTGEIFASCGDGTLAVIKETSAGKFEVAQSVKTRKGARTMILDPATHRIYLPAMDAPAAGESGPPKGEGFSIVVVAPQK